MHRLELPQSDYHSQVKVVLKRDGVSSEFTLDDSHKYLTVTDDPNWDAVEVTAYFCNKHGEPDPRVSAMILKEAKYETKPTSDDGTFGASGPVGTVGTTDGGDLDASPSVERNAVEDTSVATEVSEARVEQKTDAQSEAKPAVKETKHGRRRS